jgi:hypothetical protein
MVRNCEAMAMALESEDDAVLKDLDAYQGSTFDIALLN